jgi:hypothetical protein
MKKAYTILARRPEENTPLGRRRRRLEDNIMMDLVEIGLEAVDWIRLGLGRNR